MTEIQSYAGIKGYMTRYALSDPYIRQFVWGESKRMLDVQSGSAVQYPYLHVESINLLGRSLQEHTQRFLIWQMHISIAGAAPRDDIQLQEARMTECGSIVWNLLVFLLSESIKDRIHFDLDRFIATADQVSEVSDNWGWEFTLQIGVDMDNCQAPDPDSLYEVIALSPQYSGSPGDIRIEVNAVIYSEGWDSTIPAHMLLNRLVTQLTGAGHNALADGDLLFLHGSIPGPGALTFDLNPAGNSHTWNQLFT